MQEIQTCRMPVAVEISGTVLSSSLLLLADVAHLASDLSALSISFAASYFSAKPPSARWSYGFHRAEIIFALLGVLVIWGYSGVLVDPAAALAVLLLVLPATVSLLTGNVAVLMEATPPGVSPDTVKGDLLQIASVTEVHDLHVWSVAVNLRALSVHLVAEAEPGQQGRVQREVLEQAQEILLARHAIDHTTIQARPAPPRPAPGPPRPPRARPAPPLKI
eukprot:tig00000523_g1835.t1